MSREHCQWHGHLARDSRAGSPCRSDPFQVLPADVIGMIRPLEILLLLVASYIVFFSHLGDHGYIKTEPLRVVVVKEMLDHGGPTMPTIHGAPYLKKPPLYAWTDTWLAQATGRFDPFIARLPSAIAGTLLVLLLYVVAESWIGRGAGFAAGVLAMINPTVADYAVRAELDMPFAFFSTAGVVLTLMALRRRGAAAAPLWLAAYALALAGAMWKGPHSLIFMWLAMIGYGRLARDWHFLRSAFQWIGLAIVLGVLIWWAEALARFAGPAHVGRTAGIELFARLVPHNAEQLVSILLFIPIFIVITLPAPAFALLSFRKDVRDICGLRSADQAGKPRERWTVAAFRGWWRGLRANPLGVLLLAWLAPNVIFMAIAPAKAPRYSLPIFAPMFLLGAWMIAVLAAADPFALPGRHLVRVWRAVFAVLAVGGLFALLRLLAGFAGSTFGLGKIHQWQPWLIMAVGWSFPLFVELARAGRCGVRMRMVLLLIVLWTVQPVLNDVWWPARVAADSAAGACREIDETVPAGDTVYVVGVHEYPAVELCSARPLRFVDDMPAAVAAAGGGPAYCILRADELDELSGGAEHRTIAEFRQGDRNHLFVVAKPALSEK